MSWEAIRRLPLCEVRKNGKEVSLYIPGEDMAVAEAMHPPIWRAHHPSEPSIFDVYYAAAEARTLLKEHERAVELLEELIEFHDEDQEGSGDEWGEFIGRVDEFLCPTPMNVALGLHGLDGSDKDREGADGTGKIEENK